MFSCIFFFSVVVWEVSQGLARYVGIYYRAKATSTFESLKFNLRKAGLATKKLRVQVSAFTATSSATFSQEWWQKSLINTSAWEASLVFRASSRSAREGYTEVSCTIYLL